MFYLSKLFSSCTSAPKKPRKPQIWVWFDLDGTIFNIPESVEELTKFRSMPHLTEVFDACGNSIFMIYRDETSAVIRELQDLGVNLAIMTTATYGISTLQFLERALSLDKGSLKDTLFINRFIIEHIYLKGEKLKFFKRIAMIGKDDFVLLVDNQDDHVDSAIDNGFAAIIAEGHHQELEANGDVIIYRADKSYLLKILELVKLQLQVIAQQAANKEFGFTVERANLMAKSKNQIVARPGVD